MHSAPADGPTFDCCNATVYANPTLVLGRLLEALTGAGFDPKVGQGPPVQFYAQNALLLAPSGHRLLSVRSGGANFHPFVECKGAHSGVVADAIRQHFDHVPARLDSAHDLRGPTVWQDLCRLCDQFEAEGVKLNHSGAARENPDRGTTIYLGSRFSQSYVRVYQKGLQIAEEMGLTGADIPDELRHWVRVELEYKPDKRPARVKASKLSPAELWGSSPWTRRFAKLALSIDAERIRMHEKRESNEERALRYMGLQYGTHLASLFEQCDRDLVEFGRRVAKLARLEGFTEAPPPPVDGRASWELRAASHRLN